MRPSPHMRSLGTGPVMSHAAWLGGRRWAGACTYIWGFCSIQVVAAALRYIISPYVDGKFLSCAYILSMAMDERLMWN